MGPKQALCDEGAALSAVEALIWPTGPVCPRCGHGDRLGRLNGHSTSQGAWKCYHCRKPFTARSATPFRNSHIPLQAWLQAVYLLAATDNQTTSMALGRILGISQRAIIELRRKIAPHATGLSPRIPGPAIAAASVPAATQDDPMWRSARARYARFLKAVEGRDADRDGSLFLQALTRMLEERREHVPVLETQLGFDFAPAPSAA